MWNLEGQQLVQFKKKYKGGVNRVIFSPDSKRLVVSEWGGAAYLWDLRGNQLAEFNYDITTIAFSFNGLQLATGGFDRTIRLWNKDGKLLTKFKGHAGTIGNILFTHDGKQVLTTASDGFAKLWDLEGNQLAIFRGHYKPIRSAILSPNGKLLATGGCDAKVRLWDLEGNQLAEFNGREDCIGRITFTTDSKRLFAITESGVYIWQIEGLEELRIHGCNWVKDYLNNNPYVEKEYQHICD
ncbi:MAG: hypothetical protein HC877_06920 [Thioploca sp.]|nr:hypothetical protein [Thioploca sp.]